MKALGRKKLYAIARGDQIKVGISSNPETRCVSRAQHNPRLIAQMDCADAAYDERLVHWLLRDHRANGEWFNCSEDQVLDIFDTLDLLRMFFVLPKPTLRRWWNG